MTKKDFIKKCSGAPWSLEEIAEKAAKVADDTVLQDLGERMYQSHDAFRCHLEQLDDFEWG